MLHGALLLKKDMNPALSLWKSGNPGNVRRTFGAACTSRKSRARRCSASWERTATAPTPPFEPSLLPTFRDCCSALSPSWPYAARALASEESRLQSQKTQWLGPHLPLARTCSAASSRSLLASRSFSRKAVTKPRIASPQVPWRLTFRAWAHRRPAAQLGPRHYPYLRQLPRQFRPVLCAHTRCQEAKLAAWRMVHLCLWMAA